jgi:hypothetical protein
VGFVVDKVEPGQVLSEYFGFPCQISFHQLLQNHLHHQSSGICTIGQMDKRLWTQYKDLIDTSGLETKIPRDSGPPQTDKNIAFSPTFRIIFEPPSIKNKNVEEEILLDTVLLQWTKEFLSFM